MYWCSGQISKDFPFLTSSRLTTSIHWPYHCTVHVYVIIHFSCGLIAWKRICVGFCIVWLYIHVYVLLLEIRLLRMDGVPLSCSTTPHCRTLISYIIRRGGFMFNGLRWDVILRFVDVGDIALTITLNFPSSIKEIKASTEHTTGNDLKWKNKNSTNLL